MFMDSETQSKYAKNGKVVLASTTLFFLLLLIVIFLYSFRHSCFRRRRNNHRNRHRVPTNFAAAALNNKGLHPSLLASLPTFTHSSSSAGAGDSCAVCMSEFVAGEEGRALPSCRHAFHSHCIDVWFRSHSNCPLCRTPVQPGSTGSVDIEPGLVSWFPEPVWCPSKPLKLEEEQLRKDYCININLATHM